MTCGTMSDMYDAPPQTANLKKSDYSLCDTRQLNLYIASYF